jgi:hypothetical protein
LFFWATPPGNKKKEVPAMAAVFLLEANAQFRSIIKPTRYTSATSLEKKKTPGMVQPLNNIVLELEFNF